MYTSFFLLVDLASVSLCSAHSTALFASVVACIDSPLSLGVGSALAGLKYLRRLILGAYNETCSIQNLKRKKSVLSLALTLHNLQTTGSSCCSTHVIQTCVFCKYRYVQYTEIVKLFSDKRLQDSIHSQSRILYTHAIISQYTVFTFTFIT